MLWRILIFRIEESMKVCHAKRKQAIRLSKERVFLPRKQWSRMENWNFMLFIFGMLIIIPCCNDREKEFTSLMLWKSFVKPLSYSNGVLVQWDKGGTWWPMGFYEVSMKFRDQGHFLVLIKAGIGHLQKFHSECPKMLCFGKNFCFDT